MSQKVRILKVRHTGCSVFLGLDPYGNRMWTRNPDRIMDWLCDGWRSRYNQHRAQRPQRRLVEDVITRERMWVDVPLGGADVNAAKNILSRALNTIGMDDADERRQHVCRPVQTGGGHCR